jgi:indole-3-glycerol phosphate synthase
MILDKIFEFKKEELEHFKRKVCLEDLKGRCRDLSAPHSFLESLRNCPERFAIIAEIKRMSPSKGVIREDFDPEKIAQSYAENGAAAISVLTDEHFFGGHLDHLRKVREKVSLPLLRKDFIWDPYQIFAAREAGADAILLIVAMLEKNQIQDLQGLGEELGLSVLVEVHHSDEVTTANSIGAKLVGINNRDLKTFKVDVQISQKLIPLIAPQAIKVSESGLDSTMILEKLKNTGAHAFLIGETLMKAKEPGKALKETLK